MKKSLQTIIYLVLVLSFVSILTGCLSTPSSTAEDGSVLVDMFDAKKSDIIEFPAVEATASAYQESKGLVPAFAIDGDVETTWTAEGKQWIVINLGGVKKVSHLEIAMLKGSQRKYRMMFEGSTDGTTYKTILPATTSSGKSEDFEMFDTINTEIQYVRINVSGASSTDWNNIREVKIFGIN